MANKKDKPASETVTQPKKELTQVEARRGRKAAKRKLRGDR